MKKDGTLEEEGERQSEEKIWRRLERDGMLEKDEEGLDAGGGGVRQGTEERRKTEKSGERPDVGRGVRGSCRREEKDEVIEED